MIICKIWDADYPWDIRVEKVCRSLQTKHRVHLVCRNSKRQPLYEEFEGTSIHRLPFLPHWLGPLNSAIGFPLFFNPTWFMAIWTTVRRTHAELILVRDLPLALTAVMVGRWFKIPVVLDLAENYPAMLQDRLRFTPTGLLGRLLRHPAPARLIERLVLCLVDHIIVVVEESRDRLIEMGLKPKRITIVSNTPPLDRWRPEDRTEAPSESRKGIHLVYLGNLDGSRGIDTAIRAVRLLKDMGQHARLSIIGTGPNIDQFRCLAAQLSVTDRVAIMGRQPFHIVQAIMAEAYVGVIPHYATDAW
ncbi:MAG: glycosyltransferase family 4 protein, partial [Nitrospirae bacterium]